MPSLTRGNLGVVERHVRAMRSVAAVAVVLAGCAATTDPNITGSGTIASSTAAEGEAGSSGASGTSSGGDDETGVAESASADTSSSSGVGESSTGDDGMHGDPAADVPEFLALLDDLEGWGVGTTGGIDGTIFVVDTLDDDGPTSLRAALTSGDPLWIVFAPGLDGVIALASTIEVASNKTVDARGHAIQIRTLRDDTGFQITGQTNIILTNLVFDDEVANWDQDSEGEDGITIHDSSYVWVHHCSFARWLDGAIDIRHDTGELSNHISVTWSRFEEDYQALNWTADRISFGHNVCDRVRRRCIQMIDGKGHSYNNVVGDWNSAAIQNSKDGAQLYSQHNMFVPGGFATVNSRVNGGKIRNSGNHSFGNVQFDGGNDALDQSFMDDSEMLAVITTCADGDDACWEDLRTTIEAQAGAM
jgi:pectate lyase